MTTPAATALGLTESERARVERIDQLAARGPAAVHDLIAGLADPSWTVRRAAVAALAAIGDPASAVLCDWLATVRTSEREIAAVVDALAFATGETVDVCVATLADRAEPAVVADAAAILGRRGAHGALPVLVRLLAHGDANVAVAAVEALGRLGDPAAIEPLIATVAARDFFRTFAAIQVLARSPDPRVIAPLAALATDETFRAEALAALGRTGSPFAVAPLAAALAAPGTTPAALRSIALALAELLARAGWSGADTHVAGLVRAAVSGLTPRLAAALAGATPAERVALATLLGHSGDPAALPALTPLLAEAAARPAAVAAIAALGRAAPDAIQSLLVTGDTATRVAILPTIGAVAAAPRVRSLLTDEDAEVRAAACEALARIGDTAAVPALFGLLADPSLRVVHTATAAIHSLNTPGTAALALAALRSERPAERKQALRILAYLGPRDVFEPVSATLADPDPRIAELAVTALGALDDPRTEPALAALAGSPVGAIRAAVMRVAGHRGGDSAVPLLLHALADADAWVRYYACQGLGRLRVTATAPALIARLGDAMPHVRVAAIEALARLATPTAWQALASAARSSDPDEQRAALVGMGATGRPEAIAPLLEAATATDLATRLIALDGLARHADPRALAALRVAAAGDDPELRDAAVALLAAHSAPAAFEVLVDVALAAPPEHPAHGALSRPPTAAELRGEARTAALAARLAVADGVQATPLAAALARAATPAATGALFATLTGGSVPARRAAAVALAGMGIAGAAAAIARVADADPDPEVRRVAAAAIAGG